MSRKKLLDEIGRKLDAARPAQPSAPQAPPVATKTAPPEAAPAPLPGDVIAWFRRYLSYDLSVAWAAVLAAFYGLRLEEPEAAALEQLCGFRETGAPAGYSEALVIAGRRAGKSMKAALLGLFEACVRGPEHMQYLAPGQRGYVVVISRTQRQALECFRYARGAVESNPELLALLEGEPLESQSGGELRFSSGVVFTVMPASKSSVRGFTILAAILDELAWFGTDEDAADQDVEIATAVRYAMPPLAGAPRRRLISISSPAGKAGIVFDYFSRFHGEASAPVLVAKGTSFDFNPSLSQEWAEEERKRDPKKYQREILAEFQDSVSAFLDGETIDRASRGRTAQPIDPVQGVKYFAAGDIGLKRDSTALCIGHLEIIPRTAPSESSLTRVIVDGAWVWTPRPGVPLDTAHVVREMSSIARRYSVSQIVGDQFAIGPLQELFRAAGLIYLEQTATNRSKLDAYTRLRELLHQDRISLPAHERLLAECRAVEERLLPGGNVQIGHPRRGTAHDDMASALAWLLLAMNLEPSSAVAWRGATLDRIRSALQVAPRVHRAYYRGRR